MMKFLYVFILLLNFSLVSFSQGNNDYKLNLKRIERIVLMDLEALNSAYGEDLFFEKNIFFFKKKDVIKIDTNFSVSDIKIGIYYFKYIELNILIDKTIFHNPSLVTCEKNKISLLLRNNEIYRVFGLFNSDVVTLLNRFNFTPKQLVSSFVFNGILKKGKSSIYFKKSLKNKNFISYKVGKPISIIYSLYGCNNNYLIEYSNFFESKIVLFPPISNY